MSLKTTLSAFLLLAAQSEAFWRLGCRGTVATGRLDPIVEPNAISAHVHSVHGGSNFGMNSNAADLLASECTSCQVKQDKSAYWKPALYFRHDSGTFEMVDEVGGTLVYYELNPDEANSTQGITAFPHNFRMISGNNFKRGWAGPNNANVPQSLWTGWETTQPFLEQKALGFNCLNYNAPAEAFLGRNYMPDKAFIDAQCTDGIRFEVAFPSCWNGKDLDMPGHKSHVAFPTNVIAGNCPSTHPIKLPTLMFETIRDTHKFAGQPGQFVLANGDPTGFGSHGDFLAAWEDGVLQQAVDKCTDLSGIIESCDVFDLVSLDDMNACKATLPPQIASVDVLGIDGKLTMLPGNVTISTGPEPAQPPKDGNFNPGKEILVGAPDIAGPINNMAAVANTPSPSAGPSTTMMTAAKPSPAVSSAEVASPVAGPDNVTADDANQVAAGSVTTPAPSVEGAAVPGSDSPSTLWSTNGNTVVQIEIEETTEWVGPTAAPVPHAMAHLRKHKRHAHHHDH